MKIDFTSAFKDTTTLQVPQKKVTLHKKTHCTDKICRDNTSHEAIVPEGMPYTDIDLAQPIDTEIFAYELDLFQRISCIALERDENVLVCAHTASGKTAIAEYAIHLALKRKQRVVYTSPIKALSNQKYRELKLKFDDVGLITGDSTLNPKASVLVMTTEILRNMLYRSNELVGEIKFVIFDEIHYMTDRERGVVWEECIILSTFNCVFLSATLPNANEFAEWVVNVQGRVCHIVSNDRRVVPLIHYVFPVGGKGLFKIKGGGETDAVASDAAVDEENDEDRVTGGYDGERTDRECTARRTKEGALCGARNGKKGEKGRNMGDSRRNTESSSRRGTNVRYCGVDGTKMDNHTSTESNDDRLAGGDERRGRGTRGNKRHDDTSGDRRRFNRGKGREEEKHKKSTNKKRNTKKVFKVTKKALKAHSPTSTVDFNVEMFNEAIQNIKKSRVDYADIKAIIGLLTEKALLPVIVFNFRRKDCENFATCLEEDYNSTEEKEHVTMIFNKALETLRVEDRALTPIQSMLPLLLRGIGIHHSGLLPVLKEIIEILFSLNLIKVLFATETFSIGLNMPAKCVLFTTLFKFDGEKMRTITSGEYIQMSGRAGRRGIDKEGICISILTEAINIESAVALFNGRSNPLQSAFYLTYNMILNLLKIEGLDPVYVLERSFFHYQKIKGVERLRDTVNYFYGLMSKVEGVKVSDEGIDKERSAVSNACANNQLKDYAHNSNTLYDHLHENNDSNKDMHKNGERENSNTGEFEFVNDALSQRKLEDLSLSDLLVKGRLIDVTLNVNGFPIYLQNCIISSVSGLKDKKKKGEKDVNLEVVVLLYNRTNKMKRKCIRLCDISAIYDARVKINNKRLGRKYSLLYGTPVIGHYCTICEEEVSAACLEERCFFGVLEQFMEGAGIEGLDEKMLEKEEEHPIEVNSAMTMEYKTDSVSNGDMSGYVNVSNGMSDSGALPNGSRSISREDVYQDEKSGKRSCDRRVNGNTGSDGYQDRFDKLPSNKCLDRSDNESDVSGAETADSDQSSGAKSEDEETSRDSSTSTSLPCTASPVLKNKILKYLNNVYNTKNSELFVASRIDHIDQCTKMIQVLRRLDYYDNNSVTVKGRVACELNTEELVLTELIFNGHFLKLSVIEVVSLLSCLVFTEKEDAEVSEQSLRNYKIIEEVVQNVVKVMNQVGLNVQVEDFPYSNELMDVVRMWAAGASFESVTARTQVFEGSIVRCLKRLDEMLRQLSCAARAIGNLEMERIFGEGISKIKRDIVFCNSLYL